MIWFCKWILCCNSVHKDPKDKIPVKNTGNKDFNIHQEGHFVNLQFIKPKFKDQIICLLFITWHDVTEVCVCVINTRAKLVKS